MRTSPPKVGLCPQPKGREHRAPAHLVALSSRGCSPRTPSLGGWIFSLLVDASSCRTQSRPLLVAGLILAAGVTLAPTAWGADDVPYGHPDFYPTDDRPIGFRADGRGHYPGANLPDLAELPDGYVVWEAPMERPGMAGPLVVGEKVFVLSDPWTLHCLLDGTLATEPPGPFPWPDLVDRSTGLIEQP